MARNSKIVVDLEFGDIDEAKVKALGKQIGDKLRKEPIDMGWKELEQSIAKVSKQIDSADKDRLKSSERLKSIDEKIVNTRKQFASLDKDHADAIDKIGKLQSKYGKDLESQHGKIAKAQENINKLSGKDTDEARKKIESHIAEQQQAGEKIAEIQKNMMEAANEPLEQANKLKEDQNKIESDLLNLEQEREKFDIEQEQRQETLAKLQEEEIDRTKQLKKMQQERAEMVSALATEIKKMNKDMTDEEALKQAKKYVSYDEKQTKFEKKHHELFMKTKKVRKEELKDRLKEARLQSIALKTQHVGWLERGKIFREERKHLRDELGFKKKPTITEKIAEKASPGAVKAVAGEQGAQLLGVVGKLAAPLLALGGIAGIIMMILKFNKEVSESRKQLFLFGAAGSDAWDKIENGNLAGAKSTDGYIKTLSSMFDRVGMKYDEALQNVGALTNAGIKLNDVMKRGGETFVEVEHMSMLSGKSFGEMAAISGEWVTDMNVGVSELGRTFTMLRHDAAKSEMTTSRFFSSVMNAAQGLMLYGTNVTDVSTAMANLVKGSKFGQKEATKLASSLVSLSSTMTDQQKMLVMDQTDAMSILGKEHDALKANREERDKEVEALTARQAKLAKQGKSLSAGDEEHLKSLTDQQKRFKMLNETIFESDASAFEKSIRAFEALKPAEQISAAVKAVVKQKNLKINIEDPKELYGALIKYRKEFMEMGKSFGLSADQWKMVEDLAENGKSLDSLGKQISDEEVKRLDKEGKKQANIIAQGTKPIQDIIEQQIQRWLRDIYLTIEKLYVLIENWLGKDYKSTKQTKEQFSKDLRIAMKAREQLSARVKELEHTPEAERTPDWQRQYSAATAELEGADAGIGKLQSGEATLGELEKQYSGLSFKGAKAVGMGDVYKFATGASAKEKKLSSQMFNSISEKIQSDIDKMTGDSRLVAENIFGGIGAVRMRHRDLDREAIRKDLEHVISGESANLSDADKTSMKSMFIGGDRFKRGGYTGSGSSNDIAGMVHGKEFVFDSDSTKKAGAANLMSLMNSIKTTPTSTGGGNGSNYNNTVTIQVNQRDKQEIEQIIRKVLYSERPVGY